MNVAWLRPQKEVFITLPEKQPDGLSYSELLEFVKMHYSDTEPQMIFYDEGGTKLWCIVGTVYVKHIGEVINGGLVREISKQYEEYNAERRKTSDDLMKKLLSFGSKKTEDIGAVVGTYKIVGKDEVFDLLKENKPVYLVVFKPTSFIGIGVYDLRDKRTGFISKCFSTDNPDILVFTPKEEPADDKA